MILISVIAFGFGADFPSWGEWSAASFRESLAALLKARMWEVLAIIGASQLLVLPVIGKGTRFRIAAIAVLLVSHAILSQWFNVHFVLAKANVLDGLWGASNVRAWDGGFFGVINWAAFTLAGTIAYDCLAQGSPNKAVRQFATVACCCMIVGYALSCLSTLYDLPNGKTDGIPSVAESPVIPTGTHGSLTFAEAPFTPVATPDQRQVNYWMMSKRIVTLPFVLFAGGFIFSVLAVFVFWLRSKKW